MQLGSFSSMHRCALGLRAHEAFLQGSIRRSSLCLFGHVVPKGAILQQRLPAGNEWTREESQGEAELLLLSLQQPTQRGRAERRCLQQRSQPLARSSRSHRLGAAGGQMPRGRRLPGQMEGQRPGCKAAAAVLAGSLLSSVLQATRVRALQGSPPVPLLEDVIPENISWAAEEAQGNESSEHAFFSLDYQHVQVPFEITLWIMLASLAKIGKAS